ncbi:MAG: sensor hybrid histidine kinase [Myxococcaceae bacterium]|nr:sensor hybrid histidine kinase [Myxococcaceae bacterium]
MSETAKSQSKLQDLEHQFQALVECSADAIFITDFDSARFIRVNTRASTLFGYAAEELIGMTGRQLHPLDDHSVVDDISRDLIRDGSVTRHAVRLQRKDASVFWAELRSSAYLAEGRKLYVTFVRDVSGKLQREVELNQAYQTLKDTEAQLIRSSRLAAIGQLAAGVAHEVNNPAASALLNLELLEQDVIALAHDAAQAEARDTPQVLFESVRRVTREAEEAVRDSSEALRRIASVVKGLRGFVQISDSDVQRVDINEVIDAALRLVQHQVRQRATVRCELTASRPLIADRGKLIQVFINLLLNAAQAIEQGGGGVIHVLTSDSNDGVLVRVEDDGPGVPAHAAPHIFEPFFTTKEAEHGTGLGLSLCADIVHRHRGRLELRAARSGVGESRQGSGATFEIYLPLHSGLELPAASPPQLTPVERGRILIIDDDESLVRAYRRWLGRKHDVIVAYDGEEALQVLEQDQEFDVIVCDLMMPRFDGVALYEAVIARQPHLLQRIVFCSGGPTSPRYQEFAKLKSITFFDKPIPHAGFEQWLADRIRERARPSGQS